MPPKVCERWTERSSCCRAGRDPRHRRGCARRPRPPRKRAASATVRRCTSPVRNDSWAANGSAASRAASARRRTFATPRVPSAKCSAVSGMARSETRPGAASAAAAERACSVWVASQEAPLRAPSAAQAPSDSQEPSSAALPAAMRLVARSCSVRNAGETPSGPAGL